jgi:MFS family permease
MSLAAEQQPARPHAPSARTAMRFVVFLGVISLFGDMTYEGARSITGPYLAVLGASGAVVGIVAGFGELIGYALRLASGYISERTGQYWPITLIGYAVNLLAVPALALTGHWEVAALLMIAERVGKALRTPARDAMLSHATVEMGRGWGFGLHEAMDQTGALLGPLIVTALLWLHDGYRTAFAVLLIPAAAALSVLAAARRTYPDPGVFEAHPSMPAPRGWPRIFWLYLGAAALVGAGYADFALIAYHFEHEAILANQWIPAYYAMAMGVSALAALGLGRLFDRRGFAVVVATALVAAAFAPLVFLGGALLALGGMVLWGVGMAGQESIVRAVVAGMIPPSRRAAGFGVFNAGFGLAWFAGSALMGVVYDRSIAGLVAVSVGLQLAAIPLFVAVWRRSASARSPRSDRAG